LNKYELMYIIDVALEDATRKELIEKVSALITGNGGEVEKVDEWGKRRLAYSIDYKTEGYYVLVNFSATPELPREIERVLQISEDVLRYLIVKVEEKRTSVKPRPVSARPAFGRPPFVHGLRDADTAEGADTAERPEVAVDAAPADGAAEDEPEAVPEVAPETASEA